MKYFDNNLIWEIHYKLAENLQALSGARQNADEARQNAQEAQEKYAEQASKDAEIIRRKANETKSAAHQLRGEADRLNGRVVVTENRITKLSDNIKEDNALTEEAKEKVYIILEATLTLLQFETFPKGHRRFFSFHFLATKKDQQHVYVYIAGLFCCY